MSNVIIECRNVGKIYQDGQLKVEVLRHLNFSLNKQESIAILGSSGSGKSTFLQLAGGLDLPTEGTIQLMGRSLLDFSAADLGEWRNKNLGFVYQFHHLLPEFSALENVMLPLLIAKIPTRKARQEAELVLEQVGLKERLAHRPSELSGGERQRVSVARAIINRPACVLCDEPTGNLDKKNAQNILNLLHSLQKHLELALLVVTHDESLVTHFDRVLLMSDGQLTPDKNHLSL